MEPKKNPKADLKQWSGVYFLAGLAFMLFLSWQAVEWKSYDRDLSLDTLNVVMILMKIFQSQNC